MFSRRILVASLLLMCATAPCQKRAAELSQQEEEDIRDAAIAPALRIAVYQKIVDARIHRIQDVMSDKRAQGRREDIHNAMATVASLCDEIEDNLDDYETAHRDLRKPLPKLVEASQRWQSVLKQVPEDESYRVVQKLALEGVTDIRSLAEKMIPAEVAYFKEHPPEPDAGAGTGTTTPKPKWETTGR